jgi:hypothetical protein
MKRYRVWGEYGPIACDTIVWYGRAKTPENAVKRAVKEFKKTGFWSAIGMINVHVDEAFEQDTNDEY